MKVKIICEFADLVRPDLWFYPLDTEQAFCILGWMIETGQEYL